jgi:hypothetical protein
MLRRALVAVCVVTAAGLVSIATESAAAPRKPTIGRATITPKKLPGSGGTLRVAVTIFARGARLNSVRGRSTLRGLGRSGSPAVLANTGSGAFSGLVNVPNSSPKSVTADIFVEVDSSAGPVSKKVATIVLGKRDDSLPPPPPPD